MKNYIENPLIISINDFLRTCTICRNHSTRGGNFLSKDTYDLDVVFVAQNPGKQHHNVKKDPATIVPFGLDVDNYIYHQFFDIFIEIFKKQFGRNPVFYITNICKCTTSDNILEDPEMIRNCIQKFLKPELDFLIRKNKKVKIVALGKVAKEMFKYNKYLKRYKFIQVSHPGFMNRQGKTFVINESKNLIKKLV